MEVSNNNSYYRSYDEIPVTYHEEEEASMVTYIVNVLRLKQFGFFEVDIFNFIKDVSVWLHILLLWNEFCVSRIRSDSLCWRNFPVVN